jgi:hypothetical protein
MVIALDLKSNLQMFALQQALYEIKQHGLHQKINSSEGNIS